MKLKLYTLLKQCPKIITFWLFQEWLFHILYQDINRHVLLKMELVQFHLKNFDFKTDSWSTQGYLCLLCSLAFYWDTCGSLVIKCLCFFVIFFFFPATKWKNYAIVPSGHWALNTMTTNCDPIRVKVFTCWSRELSWWWLTSCMDRAESHDETRDFCL